MTELKDLLRQGADRAKHYDVTESAWVRGRRRRRRRLAAGSAAVATLVSAVVMGMTLTIGPRLAPPAEPAAPLQSCDVTQLPLPDGFITSNAVAMDPTGRFIGGSGELTGNRYSLLLWDNGEVRDLQRAGLGSIIRDINRHGDLVASLGWDFAAEPHFLRDGQWSKLKGSAAIASGLNDSGVIVGSVGEAPSRRPVVWRTPSDEPEPITLPAGTAFGWAVDITDDGYIVGWISDQWMSGWRPAIWAPQGEVRVLQVPDGAQGRWNTMMLRVIGDAVYVQFDVDSESPRYYRFALAGGDGVRMATEDREVIAFLPNGWRLVLVSRSRLTMVAGSTRIELPDLPGRSPFALPTGEPAATSVLVGMPISEDGRVMVGSQMVLNSSADRPVLEVATAWRCR